MIDGMLNFVPGFGHDGESLTAGGGDEVILAGRAFGRLFPFVVKFFFFAQAIQESVESAFNDNQIGFLKMTDYVGRVGTPGREEEEDTVFHNTLAHLGANVVLVDLIHGF